MERRICQRFWDAQAIGKLAGAALTIQIVCTDLTTHYSGAYAAEERQSHRLLRFLSARVWFGLVQFIILWQEMLL